MENQKLVNSPLSETVKQRSVKKRKELIENATRMIREEDVFENEILSKFLSIVEKTKKNYTTSSSRREVERIYSSLKASESFVMDLIDISEKIRYAPPSESQLDIIATIIKLLELTRHDLFMNKLSASIENCGGKIIAFDFKLSDHFPQSSSNLTPDVLFQKDDQLYILEVKVRSKNVDLKFFYDRYKRADIGSTLVSVCNYSEYQAKSYGDYSVKSFLPDTIGYFDDLDDLIKISSDLREKYQKYPSFSLYMHFDDIETTDPFISGFKGKCNELKQFEEVKRLYGSKWIEVEQALNKFSLIDEPDMTQEVLLTSETALRDHCNETYDDWSKNINEMKVKKSYSKTFLNMNDIGLSLDSKNLKLYRPVKKYKPSVYFPLIKTSFLEKYNGSRILFYKDAFKNLCIKGDQYSRAAFTMMNEIFNTPAIGLLMSKSKDFKFDDYKEFVTPEYSDYVAGKIPHFKKLAKLSGLTSDITILNNQSFSIKSYHCENLKQSICSYESKHYEPNEKSKETLIYKDCLDDCEQLEVLLEDNFKSEFHSGVFKNDLIKFEPNSLEDPICDIPECSSTKFMEYLYNVGVCCKSLISLNTNNSHKFRFIQTADPGTIIIMLPNADGLRGSPIRYFTISIIDLKDKKTIQLNKLLGNYHYHTNSSNYTIMLSKVMSLDMNRLRLLSVAYVKYALLIQYYNQFKKELKPETHMLAFLSSQFVTISSLSITDTYKNFIMAIYSDYSNIDELIDDKLSSRPRSLAHIFLLKRMFNGLEQSSIQLKKIYDNKLETEIDDRGELQSTGFKSSLKLKLPLTGLKVNNPKEIIQEAFILFYLGNKGLHGSPQELLKLYYTPCKFELEYEEMIKKYDTFIQELGNNSQMSFSFESMKHTSIYAYSKLYNDSSSLRESIVKNLALDEPILSIKQFNSTKSMVSNSNNHTTFKITDKIPIKSSSTIQDLETYIESLSFKDIGRENIELFIIELNKVIDSINQDRLSEKKKNMLEDYKIKRSDILGKSSSKKQLLPKIVLEKIRDVWFIKMDLLSYTRIIHGNLIKQTNVKVMDEFYRLCDINGNKTLRDFYSNYIGKNELIIRIFYKDQRTAEDREIYTGNADVRLCLYPIESIYKTICNRILEEAITISGDQKQKRMVEQRMYMLKMKKQYERQGFKGDIYSVSSDASKWSARDIFPKFILTIAFNPYLCSEEKWFLVYLSLLYYSKKVVLTDMAFNNLIKFSHPDKFGEYEQMTDNLNKNYMNVRSNWLQGNLNLISSFVHHCSCLMTQKYLEVYNIKNKNMLTTCNYMVHSDDSTFDFLILSKDSTIDTNEIGRRIIAVIKTSNSKHCITLNEKKTYISKFYKEFLSTTMINNEIFFFYMADLLPIAGDTAYKTPLDDLASYVGFINNAFSHACPYEIIKLGITLMNHLSLSTYNLQYSSTKNPSHFFKNCSDLPTQIYPRYKLPMEVAGSIPYYAADAFLILKDILNETQNTKGFKSDFIETIVTKDLLHEYLITVERTRPKYYQYLKSCMLTMEMSQYERDDQDPYNIIDYDLSQKSIINLVNLNKGNRMLKNYTFKKFLDMESDVRLNSAINPMWCISKPKEVDDIKYSILANYMDPTFVDSLIFSKPALDFGRRVISSNQNIYTLKKHVSDVFERKQIKSIYNDLETRIFNHEIDSDSLLRFLSVYIFSDKKTSVATQIFFSKREVRISDRPAYNKIVTPRSVFDEEYGRYSVTKMIDEIAVKPTYNLDGIDPKMEKMIVYMDNILHKLPTWIKLYEYPEDIDENFKKYVSYKYKTEEYDDCLIKMPDSQILSYEIYTIKIRFQSLLIQQFSDTLKMINDKNYSMPSYMSAGSFIMTIDSLMKKDMISSKVYISDKKTSNYDDYWLSRFGMYSRPNCFVTYKLDYRIKVTTSDILMPQMKKMKTLKEPFSFLNYIKTNTNENTNDIFNDFMDPMNKTNIGGYTTEELIEELHQSSNFNHKLFLYEQGLIQSGPVISSLSQLRYVMNYWIVKTGSLTDKNQSWSVYCYKGLFCSVKTISIGDSVKFSINLSTLLMSDVRSKFYEICKQINKDYAHELRNCIVVRDTTNAYSTMQIPIYIDSYGRITNRRQSQSVCIDVANLSRVDNIKCETMLDIDDQVIQMLHIESRNVNCDFRVKTNNYIDQEKILDILVDNCNQLPSCAQFAVEQKLIYYHQEYLKDFLPYMGSATLLDLFSGEFDSKSISENINPLNHKDLYYMTPYLESRKSELTKITELLAPYVGIEEHGFIDINPSDYICRLSKYRYNKTLRSILEDYLPNESELYPKLMLKICFTTGDTISKMILYCVLCFRLYTDNYMNVDNDEF
nr:RNA-dependent RNA polymerase [Emaravirus sp.]